MSNVDASSAVRNVRMEPAYTQVGQADRIACLDQSPHVSFTITLRPIVTPVYGPSEMSSACRPPSTGHAPYRTGIPLGEEKTRQLKSPLQAVGAAAGRNTVLYSPTIMQKRPLAILTFALLLALTYAYSQSQSESTAHRFS